MASRILRRLLAPLRDAIEDLDVRFPSLEQQVQKGLIAAYRSDMAKGIRTYDNIGDAGFRCYSQFEEDGILLYLLTLVGAKNRTVVEICCGHGRECMAANLIINHGFKGYLFDGDKGNVEATTRFFGRQKDCLLVKPTVTQAWITRDNIDALLRDAGASGEVDVLSLDIDGNDYHIWQAIEEISPRICVFETHDIVPDGLALTIPYRDDFFAMDKTGPELDFRSVSLGAMVKLSRAKGYTLVGSHRHGFNVFFVRNDLVRDPLREVSIAEVQDNEWSRQGQRERWPKVKDMPWIEV
jgi:hypothetical protein